MKITFGEEELLQIMQEYFSNQYRVETVSIDSHEGELYMHAYPVIPFGRKPENQIQQIPE